MVNTTIQNGDPIAWSTVPDLPCSFPFYYDNILYYGCAEVDGDPVCAVETNDDFLATEMAMCNQQCHIQSEFRVAVVINRRYFH